MRSKKLSEILRELRLALALNQEAMGKKMGMKLKMYSLYETGKYDNKSADNLNIQRLQKKITEIKKELVQETIESTPQKTDPLIAELQNENKELRQEVSNLRQEVITLHKQLLLKSQRQFAHATSPKKN